MTHPLFYMFPCWIEERKREAGFVCGGTLALRVLVKVGDYPLAHTSLSGPPQGEPTPRARDVNGTSLQPKMLAVNRRFL